MRGKSILKRKNNGKLETVVYWNSFIDLNGDNLTLKTVGYRPVHLEFKLKIYKIEIIKNVIEIVCEDPFFILYFTPGLRKHK